MGALWKGRRIEARNPSPAGSGGDGSGVRAVTRQEGRKGGEKPPDRRNDRKPDRRRKAPEKPLFEGQEGTRSGWRVRGSEKPPKSPPEGVRNPPRKRPERVTPCGGFRRPGAAPDRGGHCAKCIEKRGQAATLCGGFLCKVPKLPNHRRKCLRNTPGGGKMSSSNCTLKIE